MAPLRLSALLMHSSWFRTARPDLHPLPQKLKAAVLTAIGSILFYSRLLKFIMHLINRFQPLRDKNTSLVFPFIKKRRSRNLQILLYHRVNDEYDPFFPATPTSVFSRQMDYLRSNFNIIPLEEAANRLKSSDIPDNAAVITFDDGYEDVYLNAFPVLKNLSIPATIFLATAVIDSNSILWHDKVFSAFRETHVNALHGFPYKHITFSLNTLKEKLFTQSEVLKFLKNLDDDHRVYYIDILIEKLQVQHKVEITGLMLTWDEIKDMHRNGISFGSHTVTHPILSKVSIEKAKEEIYLSQKKIEQELNDPIRSFAYPNGKPVDFNNSIKEILKELGYICAVTTIFGTNETDQDLFELRRGNPWEAHPAAFATKLAWYKFWN
jgi:peptidoglycan/xylan/chitin deacetylase (PgdA/CDA1 family)